ncbi:MAG TPA: hypothetical protein VKK61_03010, partial [Tepidisphaeraceae bacterium]|nr:hypothetical protein [Tepidisphaeraceae bacterium]
VSALPPAAVAHARYLLKRIVPRFVEVEPVVGLWTIQGDLKRAAQRISAGAVESVPVITNLTQAIEQISRLAEPLQLAKSEPAISLSSPQPRP